MILLPLLLPATTTITTNNNNNNSKNHNGFWLLPVNADDSPQSQTNLCALSRPERPKLGMNKDPWIKGSQIVPLSRIRTTYTDKTHHGYH
jgi:hypothetical protein